MSTISPPGQDLPTTAASRAAAAPTPDRRRRIAALLATLLLALPTVASGRTLENIARIAGQEQVTLRGIGLVFSLNNSGDSGEDLLLARPLLEVFRSNGLHVDGPEDVVNARSVAVVMLSVRLPRSGARVGDRFDVRVSTAFSAQSLEGGTLYVAPMSGPGRDSPVFAIAEGDISVENPEHPTRGVVQGGAAIVRSISTMPVIAGSFDVIVDPAFGSVQVLQQIALAIADSVLFGTGERDSNFTDTIAEVIDDRRIRVRIPQRDRGNQMAFVASVMRTDVRSAMRSLPNKVVCDTTSGTIVWDADVRILPSAIAHGDMQIATTINDPQPPAPPAGGQPPAGRTVDRWVGLETDAAVDERTRLSTLLAGLNQFEVPAVEQIKIIKRLHAAARLPAKLIIDGIEQ